MLQKFSLDNRSRTKETMEYGWADDYMKID